MRLCSLETDDAFWQGMLAHELRNCLTPIAGGMALLQAAPDRPPPADLLALMDRQCAAVSGWVDYLQDLSRIGRGMVRLHRQPIDRERFAGDFDSVTLAIDDSFDASAAVHLDPSWIDKLLCDMVGCAERCTGGSAAGPIAVAVVRDQIRLAIGLDADDDPTGGNVAEDHWSRSIQCRRLNAIVQLHRGTLDVVDHQLRIDLPLSFDAEPSPNDLPNSLSNDPPNGLSTAPQQRGHGGGVEPIGPLEEANSEFSPPPGSSDRSAKLSTWVVDDTPAVGIVITALIRSLGHDAEMFQDSSEALRQIQSAEDLVGPDVMFFDRYMPGVDGVQLAAEARRRFGDRCPRLIGVSGEAPVEGDPDEAVFDHRLTKPVSITDLRALLCGDPAEGSINKT